MKLSKAKYDECERNICPECGGYCEFIGDWTFECQQCLSVFEFKENTKTGNIISVETRTTHKDWSVIKDGHNGKWQVQFSNDHK